MSDEKTEEPTDHKLEEAYKKGEGPKSTDVNIAAGLAACAIYLIVAGPSMARNLMDLMEMSFDISHGLSTVEDMLRRGHAVIMIGLRIVVPLVLLTVLVGVAAGLAQTGIIITFEPLSPNFDKVNPASGLKKLISVRSLVDFLKMVVKATCLGVVLWKIVSGLVPVVLGASYLTPLGIAIIGWTAALKMICISLLVFVIVGPVDFGIQKFMFLRDQKMSKDEIKREYKESEGDPQLKGQRKQIAQEMATSAPAQKVPGATVVVTNPTHYAVALLYKPDGNMLPTVVAKGADEQARYIRELAAAHRVPIVGNPVLARALFKLPIDSPIPAELFDSVAAVLRWVGGLETLNEAANAAQAPKKRRDSPPPTAPAAPAGPGTNGKNPPEAGSERG